MKVRPIASDQSLLLPPGPAFDLPLRRERFLARRKVLRPNHFDGPTIVRVAARFPGMMLRHAVFEIVRVPGVVTVVGTPQHVGIETHAALRSP
jgi:hypothetical protein